MTAAIRARMILWSFAAAVCLVLVWLFLFTGGPLTITDGTISVIPPARPDMPSEAPLAYMAAGFFGLLFLGCLAKTGHTAITHRASWGWLWPVFIIGAPLVFLLP